MSIDCRAMHGLIACPKCRLGPGSWSVLIYHVFPSPPLCLLLLQIKLLTTFSQPSFHSLFTAQLAWLLTFFTVVYTRLLISLTFYIVNLFTRTLFNNQTTFYRQLGLPHFETSLRDLWISNLLRTHFTLQNFNFTNNQRPSCLPQQ
jgi:hypothetical protein